MKQLNYIFTFLLATAFIVSCDKDANVFETEASVDEIAIEVEGKTSDSTSSKAGSLSFAAYDSFNYEGNGFMYVEGDKTSITPGSGRITITTGEHNGESFDYVNRYYIADGNRTEFQFNQSVPWINEFFVIRIEEEIDPNALLPSIYGDVSVYKGIKNVVKAYSNPEDGLFVAAESPNFGFFNIMLVPQNNRFYLRNDALSGPSVAHFGRPTIFETQFDALRFNASIDDIVLKTNQNIENLISAGVLDDSYYDSYYWSDYVEGGKGNLNARLKNIYGDLVLRYGSIGVYNNDPSTDITYVSYPEDVDMFIPADGKVYINDEDNGHGYISFFVYGSEASVLDSGLQKVLQFDVSKSSDRYYEILNLTNENADELISLGVLNPDWKTSTQYTQWLYSTNARLLDIFFDYPNQGATIGYLGRFEIGIAEGSHKTAVVFKKSTPNAGQTNSFLYNGNFYEKSTQYHETTTHKFFSGKPLGWYQERSVRALLFSPSNSDAALIRTNENARELVELGILPENYTQNAPARGEDSFNWNGKGYLYAPGDLTGSFGGTGSITINHSGKTYQYNKRYYIKSQNKTHFEFPGGIEWNNNDTGTNHFDMVIHSD